MINEYVNWLKSNITVKQLDEFFEITTPFLDRHNDCIQLYVKKIDKINYLLTDDGYTLTDLEMCGYSFSTPKRKELLNTLLTSYGIENKNGCLITKATHENFAMKKHFFIQAIISINDLFVTSKNNVSNLFIEDVNNFLEQYDIRYIDNAKFTGKSGIEHNFDFIIPKSKKQPDRYLKVLNSPNKSTAEAVLFSWTDIYEIRKNSKMYVFLNDMDKKINSDVITAFETYNVTPIYWSKKQKYIKELSA
nr:DUF1829 domain-containing protein [Clostridium ganghwense]